MAQTTGPILAIGAITLANQSVFHDEDVDWRIPIATGLAAGMFTLAEKAWPEGAKGIAWVALISVLFVRLNPSVPSPVESALKWWESGSAGKTGKFAPKDSREWGKHREGRSA